MKTTEEPDFGEAYRDYDKARHHYAIRKMFHRDAFAWEDFEGLNIFQGAFVWLKVFVCLVLGRWSGSYLTKNSICVMTYDECHCGEVTSWESVWTSPKLLSGWQVCVCSDGN